MGIDYSSMLEQCAAKTVFTDMSHLSKQSSCTWEDDKVCKCSVLDVKNIHSTFQNTFSLGKRMKSGTYK